MKACTITFPMRTGTGTQTVTGVVDSGGNNFIGKAFIFHGVCTLNTLMNGDGGFADAYVVSHGFDDGAGTRRSESSSDAAGFGFKVVDVGTSADYSLIVIHAQLSFGGFIPLEAYISSVSSGQFTLTYDLNSTATGVYPFFNPGQSIVVTVLGGDDLNVSMGTPVNSGGLPTTIGFQPEGILVKCQTIGSGTSTGTGGGGAGSWGWSTRTSGQGIATTYDVLQAGVGRYQNTDRCAGFLSTSLTLDTAGSISYGTTDFTTNGHVNGAYLACGGSGIIAAAGTLTQPTSTGLQSTLTGLQNKIVFLMSTGAPASTSIRTDQLQWCFGMMDGTRGNSYWCGEVGNNPSSPKGARYLSDNAVMRFGTPNGASTAFTSLASFDSFNNSAGSFTLNWAAVDGSLNEILWFALGEATIPPPPPAEVGSGCIVALVG